MKKYANLTVKHFIGTNVPLGTGENIMWDTAVNLEKLKYTCESLKIKWNSPVISLSDVVEWKNFQVKTFGTKLDNKFFKIKMSWREFCVMIIEVGYYLIGIDVEKGSDSQQVLAQEVGEGPISGVEQAVAGTSANENCTNTQSVQEYEDGNVEKLRDQNNKIQLSKQLIPCIKDCFENGRKDEIILQITEIIEDNTNIFIRLSDSEFWVSAALDKKFVDRIKNKQIQKLDIIKNVRFRGDIVQNNLVIENMARPQSLQLKVKKLVGSPIPYQRLQGVQTRGCKRKAPVIEGLSEVVGIERLVLII